MQIIPAIDIIDGKCVRLTKGDYTQQKIYNDNPVEVAKQFEAAGIQRLHLVDLDGAKKGEVVNWNVLEAIANSTALAIDFSGGLSSTEQVMQCFNYGAAYAAVGSIAIKNKPLLLEWLQQFGANKFIIGADVQNELIAIKGWTENTTINVFDLINDYHKEGLQQFFCTDISKDGLLQGPSIELYKKIITTQPTIQLIASGGISTIEDIKDCAAIGCSGVIIGKAIYENKISLTDLATIF